MHEDYLAQLDRLAAAGIADPEVRGQIADLLTADYERQTAALQAAKATALEETYRGLRTGETTPATLPPDLAEALSEAERAETEAWWREGLAVAPDAALFEALSALPPHELLALNLAEPRFARHLSEDETARLRSLQAELRRQRGLDPAEDSEAAPPAVPLTELNTTLEELRDSVGRASNETAPDPWGVNRRRVGVLPDEDDPRETWVAAGIFGDDEGEEGEEETDDALPLDTAPLDAFEIDEDAAGELDRIGRELAERTGLSDEDIEAYGRDILKLVPGLGEALSAQDAFEAFRTAQEALGDRDLYAALEAAALGLVELAGAAPVVGKLARLGKIGLRAAWHVARGSRFRRTLATKRKQEAERGVDISDEEIARRLREQALKGARSFRRLPAGMGGRIEMPNGVTAELDYSDQSVEHIELLHRAVEDVSPINAEAVSGLFDGGRLTTSRSADDYVVNVDQGGGPTEATEAFHRAIEEAGGDLHDIAQNDRQGQSWTAPDGTTYERYESKRNGDTVIIIIPSPRAPNADGLWNIKIRFRGQP